MYSAHALLTRQGEIRLIPLNIPYVPESSKKYISEVLDSRHQQGDGQFTRRASKFLSRIVGGGEVLLTPSCTHALEMASMLINLKPGDEVILPSYTFTSAAIAITKFHAKPVFVDVASDTKCINVEQVRDAITSKTKAISWVNYAGLAPDIDALKAMSDEFGIFLIEDNAHGLGGTHQGKPLGSFGDFATQSFHATKNIQCGEGGALVINNKEYLERAEIIREKGTNRSRFVRGEINRYEWVDHGSSYLLAESLSALLVGQLEEFSQIQQKRQNMFDYYKDNLEDWSRENNFEIHFTIPGDSHTAHMFYLIANSQFERDRIIEKLRKSGVQALFHYQALADSKMGTKYAIPRFSLINSQKLTSQLFRLPLYFSLSNTDQEWIVEALTK